MHKNFTDFVKSYEPLRFTVLGLKLNEHIPQETSFVWPQLARMYVKTTLGIPITYFDARPSMTREGKKLGDMAFITYLTRMYDRDAENVSRGTKTHYWLTKLRYFPELWYINRNIGTPDVDSYILRWAYLLDVNPSFVDLIHGTSADTALFAIKNLK